MNAPITAAVLLSTLMLSACASMEEKSANVQPRKVSSVLDDNYVTRVETIARRRGIQVVWVNPPQKSVNESEEPK
ncbi:hypothetical protein [Lysobacter fragariae]